MSAPATTAPASPILGPSVSPRTIDSFLRAVPSVDEVGVAERAGALSTRSVKRESKLAALDLAIRMCDLTTLEGRDTPGKVIQLASKTVRPDPTDPSIPPVAALCVYPNMVPHAVEALAGSGSGVAVASVATYFPSGQAPLEVKTGERGFRHDLVFEVLNAVTAPSTHPEWALTIEVEEMRESEEENE